MLSEHANGVDKTTLDFTTPNQTTVTDAAGRQSIYHTARRNGVPIVTSIDGPGCSACGVGDIAYAYNDALQVRRVKHKDGSVTVYHYDPLGRLHSAGYETTTGQTHTVAEFTYLGDTHRVHTVASPSIKPNARRLIEIHYNRAGQPTQITQRGYAPRPDGTYTPITRSQTLRYAHRRLIAIDGYREDIDDITRLSYDTHGQLRRTTLPDGTWHAILARDAYGRPTQTQTNDQAEHNRQLNLRYTAAGALKTVSNGKGYINYRYGPHGQPTRIRLNDQSLTLKRDAAGRLTRIAGADGSVKIAYDNANHITQRSWHTPDGQQQAALRYGYDSAGRINEITNADGHTLKRLHYAAVSTGQAQAVRTAADTVAGPTETDTRRPGAPQTATDPHGHLISVTDTRGNTTEYGYDDFGNKVFTRSPDAGLTQYTYDGAGNLRSTTQASGHSVRLDYDTANHLIQTTISDTATHYAWDTGALDARLRMLRDDHGTETRQYDEAGHLTRLTRSVGRKRYTTQYHYNNAGQLVTKTLPGGQTLKYRYDDPGQLAAIDQAGRLWGHDRALLTGLDHDTPSTQTLTHGNGIQSQRQYKNHQLQALTIGSLYTYRYHHGRSGRITGIDDGDNIQARYRFDSEGRLDFALTPAALYGYRYDTNGNRTQTVINGQHTVFNYAKYSNQLQGITRPAHDWTPPLRARVQTVALTHRGSTPTPDPRITRSVSARHQKSGELTQLGQQRIAYNANGQPETLYNGDTLIAEYQYNPRAQRITKTVYTPGQGTQAQPPSHTTHYLYAHNRLTAEINGQGEITRQYLYYHGRPVTILQGDTAYAVHTNHLGAPIAVTDKDKTVIWQASYAPFGNAFVDNDPDGDGQSFTLNLRLPGQYADTESGLYYNHHRYYDPATGRYISSDPMGLAAGMNTYAYAKNDPVNNIDPSGLLLFAFDGTSNADTDGPANAVDTNNVTTNVVKFRDAYQADPGEIETDRPTEHGDHWYYITGAGRNDPRSGLQAGALLPDVKNTDLALGEKTDERVMIMADYFFAYINKVKNMQEQQAALGTDRVNIDIIGFSRGAAEARIFANLLDSFLKGDSNFLVTDTIGTDNAIADFTSDQPQNVENGDIASNARLAREFLNRGCFHVNLRFLGLWDTVPHIGSLQVNDSRESYGTTGDVFLGIPDSIDFTAHASALDEGRSIFDSWSIYSSPNDKIDQTGKKLEKGFVGAHTDIGGAGASGDLSDIALNWIIKQANDKAGVPALNLPSDYKRVTNPLVNDAVYQAPIYGAGRLYQPGRKFRYLDYGSATDVDQWKYKLAPNTADDLDFEDTLDFIDKNIYQDTATPFIGDDHMTLTRLKSDKNGNYLYYDWLKAHYGLDVPISAGPPGG